MDPLLDVLNPAQRQAVEAGEGPILVLAGPGSGKTRVLTHRIAYLVGRLHVPPYRIMAVTFTNKAAREMKARLEGLIGSANLGDLTIGTFHSVCAWILRREALAAGLDPHFLIYDQDDQERLVKQALAGLNFDDKQYQPSAMLGAISNAKNDLQGPDDLRPADYRQEVTRRVYARYQELLEAAHALDFDDLLLRVVALFRDSPETLRKYRERYRAILVDEFQDTNLAQFEIVRLLAAESRHVFVVGDEDQSIYSWRGADFRNVRRFRRQFPEARTILLEQNYRSTQNILNAAQAVIDRNVERTGKRLWTENAQGQPLTLFEAYDEREEAQFVVDEIGRLIARGICRPGECAVMYRTNAQSRVLEEEFMRRGVPYRVVGATRFYGRREIKDVVAYLRLVYSADDPASLSRVLNVPPRGIGDKTAASFRAWADGLGLSFSDALERLASDGDDAPLDSRSRRALLAFHDMMEDLRRLAREVDLLALLEQVVARTGYIEWVRDGSEEGEERWQNVLELRTVARDYAAMEPLEGLAAFLTNVALVADVDTLQEDVDTVTLLTLHAAKGLEFKAVFLVGLDEGIFPHSRCLRDRDQMEEERRLCYVGLTRAKERLYLTHTFRRTIYGNQEASEPSRFLRDIPEGVMRRASGPGAVHTTTLHERAARPLAPAAPQAYGTRSSRDHLAPRPTGRAFDPTRHLGRSSPSQDADPVRRVSQPGPGVGRVSQPGRDQGAEAPTTREPGWETRPTNPTSNQFSPGDRVQHPAFGRGTVISSELRGGDEEVTVAFEGRGIKKLVASIARMEKVS